MYIYVCNTMYIIIYVYVCIYMYVLVLFWLGQYKPF